VGWDSVAWRPPDPAPVALLLIAVSDSAVPDGLPTESAIAGSKCLENGHAPGPAAVTKHGFFERIFSMPEEPNPLRYIIYEP
jgi:hypothetical protein